MVDFSDAHVVTKREEALNLAAEIIVGERDTTYGGPEDNLGRIAKIWTVILEREVTPNEVANCMIAVKLARLVKSPQHLDSMVDIAGYAACGYELAQRE